MKTAFLFLMTLTLACAGCGYASVGNDLVCQPKKIHHVTPIFCPTRDDVDVSMVVMVNGVGSMSTADMWLTVPNPWDRDALQRAIDTGKIVHIRYDEARFRWCDNEDLVANVTVDENAKSSP